MPLTGGCYCGAIRYEASDEVFHKTICHCEDCRRVSGAPCVAWFSVMQPDFQLTKGVPARLRSSQRVTRTFCAACGTPLTYQHDDTLTEIDITIGSLDHPDSVVPEDHTFTCYRLSWVKTADGLPEYQHYARAQKE